MVESSPHNLVPAQRVRVHMNYPLCLAPQHAPHGYTNPSILYQGNDYCFKTFEADLLRAVPNPDEPGPAGIVVNNVHGVSTIGSKLSLGNGVHRLGNGWIDHIEFLEIPKDGPPESCNFATVGV